MKKNIAKNLLLSCGLFSLAVLLGFFFFRLSVEEHITTIFVFAVFLILLLTDGYIYGVCSAIAAVFAVNYAFTFPYLAFNFIIPVNLISAVIMLTVAILTGMLTSKLKRQEMMKAESERERMRANLLRAVSHDLRTPLTTIYSASGALREQRGSLSEEQVNVMLKSIQQDAEWLVHMVENLLSITRIDSGNIQLIKEPTVLDELIDSVMSKFHSRCPAQSVELNIPADIVVIPMDTILIEQVILNLLENAVTHAVGMKTLSLRVYTVERKAVFEISDDGCGIDDEKLAELFLGAGAGSTANSDGRTRNAGIGLSVCATIIKAHGGEISAENNLSGGACFRFSLATEDMCDDEQ